MKKTMSLLIASLFCMPIYATMITQQFDIPDEKTHIDLVNVTDHPVQFTIQNTGELDLPLVIMNPKLCHQAGISYQLPFGQSITCQENPSKTHFVSFVSVAAIERAEQTGTVTYPDNQLKVRTSHY